MKFNPVTQTLITKKGRFIKKLHCPKNIDWRSMSLSSDQRSRLCDHCEKQVLDIKDMTGSQVRKIIKRNPQACLKLEPGYSNIRVVTTDD